MALTDISDRLTPSAPIEFTFGAQPIATGKKFTTLFGHMTQAGGSGTPYQVYTVVNVGDAAAAQKEVDTLAGTNSQIGKMTAAFINSNVIAARSNFPAFRVVLIPYSVANFGPNQEALNAIQFLRSDTLVSCYPASDSTNLTTLLDFTTTISGVDRDLQGQFGSFAHFGSIDSLSVSEDFNINSRYVIVDALPDTNNLSVDVMGTVTSSSAVITAVTSPTLSPTANTTSGSPDLTAISSTAGIYPGASISGTGIPTNSIVVSTTSSTITINQNATATGSAITLTINNSYGTIGIYPGAILSGTDIPTGATVLSVTSNSITMSAPATGSASNEAITVANQISQPAEIVAAASAAGLMSLAFPYNPVQGVEIGGLVPPQNTSDWIAINPNGASEQALVAGLSPLRVMPGNTVGYIRSRTTYNLLPDNVTPVTAYFDWQDLVIMNDFREGCYLIIQNPPFNNNPGGTKASQAVAGLLKNEILRLAQSFEDQGAFQGVQSLAPQFLVAPSTTSRGRFDFQIPINVIPGLYVIAGNIQAVTTFDFTL